VLFYLVGPSPPDQTISASVYHLHFEGMGVHVDTSDIFGREACPSVPVKYFKWLTSSRTGVAYCDGLFSGNSGKNSLKREHSGVTNHVSHRSMLLSRTGRRVTSRRLSSMLTCSRMFTEAMKMFLLRSVTRTLLAFTV
jgi:hypothetical protein